MPAYYDETIGSLETIRFLNRCLKLTNDLKTKTHFNLEELQNILIIHYKLTKQGGPINYRRFREIAHRLLDVTGDEHYDKIYYRFDQHRAMQVNLESWASSLSVILRGSMQEKIDYCWKVYDMFNLGYVTRELMFQYMRKSIIKASAGEDSDEVVKDLVDVILKKMDIDRDGKLSYDDYKTSVEKNPMLLEALGQVLPPRPFVLSFLKTFTPKYGKICFANFTAVGIFSGGFTVPYSQITYTLTQGGERPLKPTREVSSTVILLNSWILTWLPLFIFYCMIYSLIIRSLR